MEACENCKDKSERCQSCKARAYPRVQLNKIYVPEDPANANICDGCE